MKKVIQLTESDLQKLVEDCINEAKKQNMFEKRLNLNKELDTEEDDEEKPRKSKKEKTPLKKFKYNSDCCDKNDKNCKSDKKNKDLELESKIRTKLRKLLS